MAVITKNVPFSELETKRYFEWNQPMLLVKDEEQSIQLTVTKKFSSLGFNIQVKNVSKLPTGEYEVRLAIKAPYGLSQLQVINYASTTIKIEKQYLDKNPHFIIQEMIARQ